MDSQDSPQNPDCSGCASLEERLRRLTERFESLESKCSELESQLKTQKKQRFGRKSEKRSKRKKSYKTRSPEEKAESLLQRRENREKQRQLPTETIKHKVEESQRTCPDCGKTRRPVGQGKSTEIIDLVKHSLKREIHIQETLSCGCGQSPVTAKAPKRPIFGGRYGQGLLSHLIVKKCLDSMPVDRIAKGFQRQGLPLAKSSLNRLILESGSLLRPFFMALRDSVVSSEHVCSDETQGPIHSHGSKKNGCKQGSLWSFSCLETKLVYFTLRLTKKQAEPASVLKQSRGYLVSDGSTSYNAVTVRGNRVNCGCWAHVRRKFVEAESMAPKESGAILDLIGQLYRIEAKARKQGLDKTGLQQLRMHKSELVLAKIKARLSSYQNQFTPKSPMGRALTYAKRQWESLTQFTRSGILPLDNNQSENDLRTWVVGRKNWLFVGNLETGEILAGLYSLAKSCEKVGANPETYFEELLSSLDSINTSEIRNWLPDKWVLRQNGGPSPPDQ